MSKTPLELLKEIEWSENTACPICYNAESWGHITACQLAQAISLLEAQPEPGEFTTKIRQKYGIKLEAGYTEYQQAWEREVVEVYMNLKEACDLIDRLGKEIAKLKARQWGDKVCYDSKKKLLSQLADDYGKLKDENEQQQAEIDSIKARYEEFTTGKAKFYHDVWCSASRKEPMGCPGCSCTIGKKLKSQQAEIERLRKQCSQLRRSKNRLCKPAKDSAVLRP